MNMISTTTTVRQQSVLLSSPIQGVSIRRGCLPYYAATIMPTATNIE
ncbi:MAG TPA: hypothetical protein VJJ02_05305 [Candidatus Paceibacterota bacterium]